MNISRSGQRVLHVSALEGRIEHLRNTNRKIDAVLCTTRKSVTAPAAPQ